MKIKLVLSCGVFLLICSACGRRDDTANGAKTLDSLKPKDVIVSVNNTILTKGQYLRLLDEQLALAEARNPNMTGKQRVARRTALRQTVVSIFLTRSLMLGEAKKKKMEPRLEDLAAAETYVDKICALLKISRPDYAVKYHVSESGLKRFIKDEASLRHLLELEFGDALKVSDEEVAALQTELEEKNFQSDATNAFRKARLESVRAGFATNGVLEKLEAAPETEVKIETDIHCAFLPSINPLTFFDDAVSSDEIPGALTNLAPHAFSTVFESEECYEFFQRTPDFVDTDGTAVKMKDDGEHELKLSFWRVYSPKDLGYILPTPERIRRDLEQHKSESVQSPWIERLVEAATIVYPHGTDLFSEPEE